MMRRNSLLPERVERAYVERVRALSENETKADSLPETIRGELERRALERRNQMAQPGALGLPPLLDHRRIQYGIIDSAFAYGGQCAYERILAWQIPQWEGATYGTTQILMPDAHRDAEGQTAPRAIIVSAGLSALDYLRSNGMDLGHVVTFANQGHWRLRVGDVGGKLQYMMILHAGDIVSSEDTRRLLGYGMLRPRCRVLEGGAPAHYYDVEGTNEDETISPQNPKADQWL